MANYSEFNDESFIQAFRSHEAEVIAEHVNVPLYQIIARAASLGLAGEEGVNYKYWKVKTETPEAPVKKDPNIIDAEITKIEEVPVGPASAQSDVQIIDTVAPENALQEKVSNESPQAEDGTLTPEKAEDLGQKYLRWTDDRLKELLFMNRNGFSNKDMAFKLKATEDAVKQKLNALGIYKPNGKGPIIDGEEEASSIQVDVEDELVDFMDDNCTRVDELSAFREMLRRRLILDNHNWDLLQKRLIHPETYLKSSKQMFNLLSNPKLQSPFR